MPLTLSRKVIEALEIAQVGERGGPAGDRVILFRDADHPWITATGDMLVPYLPVPGDFYLVYADGGRAFAPRKDHLKS